MMYHKGLNVTRIKARWSTRHSGETLAEARLVLANLITQLPVQKEIGAIFGVDSAPSARAKRVCKLNLIQVLD